MRSNGFGRCRVFSSPSPLVGEGRGGGSGTSTPTLPHKGGGRKKLPGSVTVPRSPANHSNRWRAPHTSAILILHRRVFAPFAPCQGVTPSHEPMAARLLPRRAIVRFRRPRPATARQGGDHLPGCRRSRNVPVGVGAAVRQSDLHRHRPQGPSLGLRVGQLSQQAARQEDPQPAGRRSHRHPGGHQGHRQGRQGDHVLPVAGLPRPSGHRRGQGSRPGRDTRCMSASRRTFCFSRTRTATARPTARRRSS